MRKRALILYAALLGVLLFPLLAGAQNIITTVAGGGSYSGAATSADISRPFSVARDSAGNLYIPVTQASVILQVTPGGQVSVVAGNGSQAFSGDGGLATSASLFDPVGVAVDSKGNLFIVDLVIQRIRRVDASTKMITTVAGNGTAAFSGDQGPATSASLHNPRSVAVDSGGNLYIADTANQRIRRVDAVSQIIMTVAGGGNPTDGLGDGLVATSARLRSPFGVTLDSAGNLYIADTIHQRIREVNATTQIITTVAGNGTAGFLGDGGPAISAELDVPRAVAFDSLGDMFIPDRGNSVIREVAAIGGAITSQSVISTVAGVGGQFGFSGDGGIATKANLNFPTGVVLDSAGNLYIADADNLRVRKVDNTTHIITTFAGGGSGGDTGAATSAILAAPVELAFDSAGNLYSGDASNNRIRKVTATNRAISAQSTITTVAGNGTFSFSGDGGPAINAGLCFSQGVAVDSQRNIFVADSCNNRIREVVALTGNIITVAGNGTAGFGGDGGPATSAELNFPEWVVVDKSGNLFIADTFNNVIREVTAVGGAITPNSIITTVAGSGTAPPGFSGDGGPAISAILNGPEGLDIDSAGNMFIADSFNNRIREVAAVGGAITRSSIINTVTGNGNCIFAGDNGPATSASICSPNAVTVDRLGNILIPDTGNNVVRRVDANTRMITTLAGTGIAGFSGDGGPANSAELDEPAGVAIDSAGNFYVADFGNNRVRRFALSIQVFPPSIDFGTEAPGFTSQPQTVTVTNLTELTLTINSIAINGANPSDFVQSNTCGTTVSPGANCTITLTFTPSGTGPRTATLTLSDSDTTSPQRIPLSGNGASIGVAVLSTSRLDFGAVALFSTSAPQTVTLRNSGNASLQITSIVPSSPNPFGIDYAETDNCGISLAAGASCTISVTFTPSINGPDDGTLTLTDSAADSPQVVQLTGMGGLGPFVFLSPTGLSFGSQLVGSTSAPHQVFLNNFGLGNLTITAIQIGPNFTESNNCTIGTPIATDGGCIITVNFAPAKAGTIGETLVINDNAPNSPQMVTLSGLAVAPAPVVALSVRALDFGSVPVGTTGAAQTILLTNSGTAVLTPLTVAPSAGFMVQSNTCGNSVAAGTSCAITVAFAPTAPGPQVGPLTLTDNAADSPQMIQLSGTGAVPVVTLSAASVSFGAQLMNTTSGAQPVILGNAGTAPLAINSIAVSPTLVFAESDNCNGSVAARGSCVIQVTFTPNATGTLLGTLTITDNASPTTQMINLSGAGAGFSMVASPGAQSAVAGQAVNYGLVVTPAQGFTGAVSFACAGLPPGASCAISPQALPLAGSPVQVMVTVATTGHSLLGPDPGPNRLPPWTLRWPLGWLCLAVLLAIAGLVKARRVRLSVAAPALLLVLLLVTAACGGGSNNLLPANNSAPVAGTMATPPGTYIITVVATSPNSPTQTFNLTLTVH